MTEHVIDIAAFNSISVDSTNPMFIVRERSEPFIIIKDTLVTGEYPLILEYNGVQKLVTKISGSAYNVKKLLYVFDKVSYIANGKSTDITKVSDYLGVFI